MQTVDGSAKDTEAMDTQDYSAAKRSTKPAPGPNQLKVQIQHFEKIDPCEKLGGQGDGGTSP